MVEFLIKFLLVVRSKLKSRASLEAENLVLRHQVIVLSRKSQSRVWLISIDRTDSMGKVFDRETIDIIRFENGQMVEHWGAELWVSLRRGFVK